MMSINAVKAVEIGDGFEVVAQRGSQGARDELTPEGFLANHSRRHRWRHLHRAGHPLLHRALAYLQHHHSGQDHRQRRPCHRDARTTGRHDPLRVGIRATPIAEAMMALVLLDHYLRHRAQNGDVKVETPRIPAAKE